MNHFGDLVEANKIRATDTMAIKEDFIETSNSQDITTHLLEPIREFLCEAFCLVDIVEELYMNASPEKKMNQ